MSPYNDAAGNRSKVRVALAGRASGARQAHRLACAVDVAAALPTGADPMDVISKLWKSYGLSVDERTAREALNKAHKVR